MWHRSAVALGLSYFALTGNISVENPSLLFPLDIYTGSLSSNPHSTLQATYSFPATSPVECRGSSKDRLPRSDPQSGSACACRWNSSWPERRQPDRAERLGIRRFYQALEFSPLLCFPNVLPAGLPASPIISIVVRYLHLLSLQLSNLGTTSQGEGRLGCLRSAMGYTLRGILGEIGWALRICRYVCTPNLRLRNIISTQPRRRAILHGMVKEHTLGNTVEARVQAGSTKEKWGRQPGLTPWSFAPSPQVRLKTQTQGFAESHTLGQPITILLVLPNNLVAPTVSEGGCDQAWPQVRLDWAVSPAAAAALFSCPPTGASQSLPRFHFGRVARPFQ